VIKYNESIINRSLCKLKLFIINGFNDLKKPLLTKPPPPQRRRDRRENAEIKMKSALRKERNREEEMGEKRIELSISSSLCGFLSGLCVSAVNGLPTSKTIKDNC
jgi:hypothetical protein